MRNITIGGILLILALLAAFLLPGMTGQAASPQFAPAATAWLDGSWPKTTGTPRAAFPFFLRLPTLTPTNTPTVTKTPTQPPATATRTGVPGLNEWQGRLVWKENRSQYYTHIEWIKFYMQIYNPTGQPRPFKILGVNISGPVFYGNNSRFHTSWTGAPDWVSAGCWGPNGNTDWTNFHRCAPNSAEGWHEDHVGEASNVEVEQAGHYWLDFFLCKGSQSDCINSVPGVWLKLATLEFNAVLPPAGAHGADISTPMPQTNCGLVLDDPDNVYMKCNE